MASLARPVSVPLVTIVAAIHNEDACLRELVRRLTSVVETVSCRAQFVLVDDASTDRSHEVIQDLVAADPRISSLRLARNEGHEVALISGIARARGDVVITLDADLQHPPERIPAMLEAWRSGFDVVHMRRRSNHARPVRAMLSAVFYALFNAVSDIDIAPGSTDFRLLDGAWLGAVREEWQSCHFLRAAARRLPCTHAELMFDAPERFAGTSNYTLRKLLALATSAVVAAARPRLGFRALRGSRAA
jgi:polyisoprenyl-phosphate glycosyltransferase